MSGAALCRLCLNKCSAYEVLSENGQRNMRYDIIRKYFDSKFLNGRQRQHLKIICLDCWRQVNDFYYFQLYISNIFVAEENISKESEMLTNPMKRKLNSDKKDEQRTTGESYSTHKTFQHKDRSPHRLLPKTIKNKEPTEETILKPILSENIQKDLDFSNTKSNQNNLSIEEEIDISFSELEAIDIQFTSDEDISISESQDITIPSESQLKKRKIEEYYRIEHIRKVAKLKLDSLRPQLAAAKTESDKAYLNQQIEDNLQMLYKNKPINVAKRNVDSLRQQLTVAKTRKEKAFLNRQIEEKQNIIKEIRGIDRRNNRRNRAMRLYGKQM